MKDLVCKTLKAKMRQNSLSLLYEELEEEGKTKEKKMKASAFVVVVFTLMGTKQSYAKLLLRKA